MEKYSKYNLIFEHKNRFFLYNTLSTSIIEIDKEIKAVIENNILNETAEDVKEEFIKNGIIVDNDLDETASFFYYYDKFRYEERLSSLNITIVPTYLCNIACSYCSQGDIKFNKGNKTMSLDDAKAIVTFLKSHIKDSKVKIKKIACDFFGGEPLLAKEIIFFLTREINDIAQSLELKPIFSLTTNAVLLNQTLIDSLIKPFDFYIQLTVDGLKDNHDSKRKSRNGRGTFENTIKVLEMLNNSGLKHKIVVRSHIDKTNVNDAENIINFYKKYTDDFYFALIREYSGNNDNYATNCISNSDCSTSWSYQTTKLTMKNKFRYIAKFGKCQPCSYNSVNTFFIDSYLDVYNCTPLLNYKEFRSGKISSNGVYTLLPATYSQFDRTPKKFSKCLNCKTMPTCGSGCAAMAFFNNGDVNTSICEAPEHILINYLKDYIEITEELENESPK